MKSEVNKNMKASQEIQNLKLEEIKASQNSKFDELEASQAEIQVS